MEEKNNQVTQEYENFEIILINDDEEFQGKLAAKEDICTYIDYSSSCEEVDRCGVDFT
ncbi:MAG: hypothetical protein QHH13_00915 [Melioribacter sp.]|uniref:hypothetical protein n=1 Tax=Rosettibacter primus TaxID=3111523 RepID=UPI00247CFBBF|nr:hypothetical protein [Melioribacter sp.]